MAISFDKALGDIPAQLALYGKRSSLLASNIANADTPNFKARDIDFRTALASVGGDELALQTTQPGHIGGPGTLLSGPDLLYRIPTQASLDGNTVNTEIEQAEFAENAVRYQSTLTFLSGRFQSLKLAITGE
jgi:flagellar basal-body rod protein FlgB